MLLIRNKQVKYAKINLLIRQYELFKMKGDEYIEIMFSWFQVIVSRLRVLNKSYEIVDHVKEILRSLHVKYRPKVTSIQEVKDLNIISLEILKRNLQSHEMELIGDEPAKK